VSGWYLTLGFDHPYGGEEWVRDPGLRIRIPFADRGSAEHAAAEVRVQVEHKPTLIQGEVIR
jgi:hypothetical protein